jgi:hypothetical protein
MVSIYSSTSNPQQFHGWNRMESLVVIGAFKGGRWVCVCTDKNALAIVAIAGGFCWHRQTVGSGNRIK